MQTISAINPLLSNLTETERRLYDEAVARKRRIAAAAFKKPDPVAAVITENPKPDPREAQWHTPLIRCFAIKDEIGPGEGKWMPNVRQIVHAVALHFGLTVEDILSNRRTKSVARPRQIACYLAKTLTHSSLPQIGRRIGYRDHTTILHGVKKIAGLIREDDKLRADVDAIRQSLLGGI